MKLVMIGVWLLALLATVLFSSCQGGKAFDNEREIAARIIALERAALDRWGKGDPGGYLELFAPDVTYFNPFEKHRIDGQPAMQKYYGDQAGQIFIGRYELTDPVVQIRGEVAILSYHLFNYKKQPSGEWKETTRWNSTKIYTLTGNGWKIVHNHWSFLQPRTAPAGE